MNVKLVSMLVVLGLAAFITAATLKTIVYFNVPASITFTMSLPGAPAATNATHTADIEFNHTSSNGRNVTPCVTGEGACQTDTIPIFKYTNTGNVNENFTLQLSANVTGAYMKVGSANTSSFYTPSGEAVSAGNWSSVNVTDAAASYCFNGTAGTVITPGTSGGCWAWADYYSYAGGSMTRREVTHTSVNAN